jgi:hypothetical protein
VVVLDLDSDSSVDEVLEIGDQTWVGVDMVYFATWTLEQVNEMGYVDKVSDHLYEVVCMVVEVPDPVHWNTVVEDQHQEDLVGKSDLEAVVYIPVAAAVVLLLAVPNPDTPVVVDYTHQLLVRHIPALVLLVDMAQARHIPVAGYTDILAEELRSQVVGVQEQQ